MTKRKPHIPETPRFSRRWFSAGLKNLVWVAVVTTLVWVYADMEFTTEQDYRLAVRLTTGNTESLMLLPTGARADIETTFKLQGNRSQLDAFQRWLNAHSGVLTYDVSGHYGPSKSPLSENMPVMLDRMINFSKQGLTLLWANPPAVSFRLDRRILVPNVPVEFLYTGARLAAPPAVKPDKVAIYVGETAWEIEASLPKAKRKLVTRLEDLKNVSTDKPLTLTVEIVPSIVVKEGQPPVPVEPAVETVQVDVKVQQVNDTKPFNVTPRIQTPLTWLDDNTWVEYQLVRKPNESWTKVITVQGAKTDVDSLKPEDIDAYVVLQDDDKKPIESWLTREVVVRFSPKLKVELAPNDKPTVSFKLEKQAAPARP